MNGAQIANRLLTLLLFAGASVWAWSDGTADLESAMAEPGKHHIVIPVDSPDQQTILPVTVVTGEQPGPVLLVIAGIHGSEYAPIVASQRFGVALDHQSLTGTVIIVHMANLPAYLGRTVYTSPVDGRNLNREFPGNAQGSLSQRIAYLLTSKLYPLADAVLDVHSGDGNEDLRPYWTGYYAKAGNAQVIERSRSMAFAFGMQHVVPFGWELGKSASAIWAGSAAVAMGIPSIDVEAGGSGVVDAKAVEVLTEGFERILSHLGMTAKQFPAPTDQQIIFDRQSIKAPVSGSWVSVKAAGETVVAGELLGYVTDWHGRTVFEARSPKDGLLMLRLSSPPVHQGETLAVVASTKIRRE